MPELRLDLPSLQLRNAAREYSAEKARETHVRHLLAHARLHLLGGDVGQHEMAASVPPPFASRFSGMPQLWQFLYAVIGWLLPGKVGRWESLFDFGADQRNNPTSPTDN